MVTGTEDTVAVVFDVPEMVLQLPEVLAQAVK
jgi:hypothetical protein